MEERVKEDGDESMKYYNKPTADVLLTEKFWGNFPEEDGTSLIITRFKGRWFTTVRSATNKQVHAASNYKDLQLCIRDLSKADMSLKREVIPLKEVKPKSTRKEVISEEKINRALKRMWESIKSAGIAGQPLKKVPNPPA